MREEPARLQALHANELGVPLARGQRRPARCEHVATDEHDAKRELRLRGAERLQFTAVAHEVLEARKPAAEVVVERLERARKQKGGLPVRREAERGVVVGDGHQYESDPRLRALLSSTACAAGERPAAGA